MPAEDVAGVLGSSALSSRLSDLNSSLPAPMSRVTVTYFMAGALARLSSAVITSPLDCIKVRTQFSQAAVGVRQYSGAVDAARQMWRHEGIIAFYRGLPMRLAYVAPAAAVSFVFYEQFRVIFHADPSTAVGGSSHSSGWVALPLLLGGALRVVGTTLRTPFDLIRQRMQVQGSLADRAEQVKRPVSERRHGIYRHSGEALMTVGKVEGLATLWTGLGATIMRDIPFARQAREGTDKTGARRLCECGESLLSASSPAISPACSFCTLGHCIPPSVIYFLTYESSKTFQLRYLPHTVHLPPSSGVDASSSHAERHASGLSAPSYMASGAFAASTAVVATMPLDLVKVRLQTQGSLVERRYSGVLDCARRVAREEGLRAFWKGCTPRILYLAPASAITFSLYEIYKRRMQRWMGLEEEGECI